MASEIRIIDVGGGQYEALRDRRVRLLPNSSDLTHVKQVVTQQRLPNERVLMMEQDGYLVDISREFERARPARVRI